MKLTREQIEAARPFDWVEGYITYQDLEDGGEVFSWTFFRALCDLALKGLEAEWKPIETAPKDGTAVLCSPAINELYPSSVMRFCGGYWGMPGFVPKIQPTHWQPLLAPPAASEGEESQ